MSLEQWLFVVGSLFNTILYHLNEGIHELDAQAVEKVQRTFSAVYFLFGGSCLVERSENQVLNVLFNEVRLNNNDSKVIIFPQFFCAA
jgi:hypothetical protein